MLLILEADWSQCPHQMSMEKWTSPRHGKLQSVQIASHPLRLTVSYVSNVCSLLLLLFSISISLSHRHENCKIKTKCQWLQWRLLLLLISTKNNILGSTEYRGPDNGNVSYFLNFGNPYISQKWLTLDC